MKKFKLPPLKSLVLSICLAGTIGVAASNVSAAPDSSLRNQMQNQFGVMVNATNPGTFNTSRRGVISGGSFIARTKVMNANIVSFVPPSIQTGCGGIDMFGGSLSFINKDQFVQLLRSVASNAAGYAFMLAIETVAPAIRTIMAQLSGAVQKLNQYLGNSCQLAQGIVNDTANAIGVSESVKSSMSLATLKGFGDTFESFGTQGNGKNPQENMSDQGATKAVSGNVVYRSLKESGVSSWYQSGDGDLLIALMSVIGTIVVGDKAEASEDGKGGMFPIDFVSGTEKPVTILTEGGEIDFMTCDGTDCIRVEKPQSKKKTIKGFQTLIEEYLIGSGGIVSKIYTGQPLTQSQQAFLENLPQGMSGQLFRLSRAQSKPMVEDFIHSYSKSIAVSMAYELISSFYDALDQALNNAIGKGEAPREKEIREFIKESRARMYIDHDVLLTKTTPLHKMFEDFITRLQTARDKGLSGMLVPVLTTTTSE